MKPRSPGDRPGFSLSMELAMGYIILLTGGSRSGKSDHALHIAQSIQGARAFVATCPVIDDEMRARVDKHIEERAKSNWSTIEEPLELASAVQSTDQFRVVVVDCLTLWINNMMYAAEQASVQISEEYIEQKCADLIHVSRRHAGTIIFVTNEVGLGVVPENAPARLFRDLVGRCNQIMARDADEVTLLACGLPIHLKRGQSR